MNSSKFSLLQKSIKTPWLELSKDDVIKHLLRMRYGIGTTEDDRIQVFIPPTGTISCTNAI